MVEASLPCPKEIHSVGFELLGCGRCGPRKYCSLWSAKSQIIYQLTITTRSSLTNHKQNKNVHRNCPSRAKFLGKFRFWHIHIRPIWWRRIEAFHFRLQRWFHRSPCPMGHGIDAEAEFLDSTFSNEMMTFPRDEKWWKYDQSSSINYTKELILRHFFFLLHISRWPCFFRFVLFLLRCFPAENYSNISISIVTLVNSRSHCKKTSPQLLIQILKHPKPGKNRNPSLPQASFFTTPSGSWSHGPGPPRQYSSDVGCVLFENGWYACCKRQKLKHSNLRHLIAVLKSLLCLVIGSATLLSPERYLCPSVQLKQFRKSSEKTAKLPAACCLLSYISNLHCQAFFHSSGDFLLNPSTNLPLSRGLCKCLRWSTYFIFFVRLVSSPFNSIPRFLRLKRRAFFVGACVLKESHQHSPGLRPRFSSGSMDLRLKRKKTLKMHICAYQTRRHFLLVSKDWNWDT